MKHLLANWKMHLGVRESVAMARAILRDMRGKEQNPHVIVFPSHTALAEVRKTLAHTKVHLGAQGVSRERGGAHTGQISTHMLEDIGATHVIVGHPEHELGGARIDAIQQTLALLVQSSIQPVIYVGQDISSSEKLHLSALMQELEVIVAAGKGTSPAGHKHKLMLVLEPGYVTTGGAPADATQIARLFDETRVYLAENGYPQESVVLCYGGHVTMESAHSFLREPAIDGLAIGAASIKLNQFLSIMQDARDVMRA